MQTETKMTDAENRGPPPPHSNDAATFTPTIDHPREDIEKVPISGETRPCNRTTIRVVEVQP